MAIPAPSTRGFGTLRTHLGRSIRLCISFVGLLAALPPTKAAEDTPSQSFALDGGMNGPEAAVFSEDLKWIATKLPSGKVKVWNVETGMSAAEWPGGDEQGGGPGTLPIRVPEVAFLRPARQLMLAAGTNVGVHDLITGKIERRLDPSPRKVTGLAVSLSGNRAVGF